MALELTQEPLQVSENGVLGDYLKFSNGRTSPGDSPSGTKNIWGSNGVIGRTEESNSPENTIVIGRVGAYCGSVAFAKEESWVTDNAIKGSLHDSDDDSRFWYYKLSSMNLRHFSHGTSHPLINQTILNNLEIRVPAREERIRIAEILGSMDDKIEANSRLLDSLSELGSALMTREISESSTTVLLSEIAEITMGQSPSGDSLNEDSEGVVFYQGRRDFGFRYPAERVYTTAPTRMAEEGDILLSVRAPVGDLNRIDKACCIGRGVAAIRAKEGNTSQLFYLLKESPQLWEPFEGEGTIFSSINRKQLHELSVPLVSQCTEYENIEENIRSLTIENNKLAETRDRLIRYLIG